jgi:hypothetical protein
VIRDLVAAILALAFAGTIGIVVIATERVLIARREQESAERRLTPAALAVVFDDAAAFPTLSREDAVIFAGLLGGLSARVRGASRKRIALYFERNGHVSQAIDALSARRSWRRAGAAYALGDMGSAAAVHPLIGALDDGARDVRAAAARSLGLLGEPVAVEPLVQALSSRRIPRGVVCQAVLALGAQAVPRLVPLLTDVDAEVRATATELIGLLGGAREAEQLVGRLGDTSAAVRGRAALALGRLGASEAYSGLDGTLGDRAPAVRAAAAEALGLIGNALAFRPLREVARNDVYEPARAAAYALARLAPDLLQQAAAEPGAGEFLREAAERAALHGSVS